MLKNGIINKNPLNDYVLKYLKDLPKLYNILRLKVLSLAGEKGTCLSI